jgi:hypothetical protein
VRELCSTTEQMPALVLNKLNIGCFLKNLSRLSKNISGHTAHSVRGVCTPAKRSFSSFLSRLLQTQLENKLCGRKVARPFKRQILKVAVKKKTNFSFFVKKNSADFDENQHFWHYV